MSDYTIIHKGEIFLKNLGSFFSIDPKSQDKIDDFWIKKLDDNPKLFDGKALCLVNFYQQDSSGIAEVSFVNYRNIIASREIPELDLKFDQVGVSGIMIFKENNTEEILFSKRSSDITEYPKYFELVPSGNLDESVLQSNQMIDFKKKIIQEYCEETKLSSKTIKNIETLGFVKDNINKVYDICCLIEIQSTREEIFSAFENSDEYDEPVLISKNDLKSFVNSNQNHLVPTSKALIECFLNRF